MFPRGVTALLLAAVLSGSGMADGPSLRRAYSTAQVDWPAVREQPGARIASFAPLPEPPPASPLSELGARLFSDPALSARGDISCASCHSGGIIPASGARRPAPLTGLSRRQDFGWDGGRAALRAAIAAPLLDPHEMANPALEEAAARAGIAPALLLPALEAHLTRLETPGRFDRFLHGETEALTETELRGFHLFRTRAGCANCHSGPDLSDGLFHNLGLSAYGEPGEDLGHHRITGAVADAGRFRTPSLRGVGRAAPYMHTGRFPTLESVVRFYAGGGGKVWIRNADEARDPLHVEAARVSPLLAPRALSEAEIQAIVAFLDAL
ncbi:cytochrome-c peroxidase [Paenirhodobacter populi]|uniref:cytochrome-c peroxidase n=1 Tax=Paenirhodobacter populi TaxID=2306993 RepID=UPI0013E2ED14|nr:cytochrome c peroxidase [Sinirhodobacter populi]